MAVRGDRWVDDLVGAVAWPVTDGKTRKEAARKQLKEMVALLNRVDEEADDGPMPPPVVLPSVFAEPGWFAVRYDKLPTPAELVDAGIKWVAAILSHGIDGAGGHSLDTDDRENQAWLAAGKAQPYRAAGVKVGGWGWNQGFRPEAEADIAHSYFVGWGLDLWIANGEEAWKGNDQPDRFAATFATLFPAGFPVAWSTLGAASGTNVFPFHYAAFTNRGWPILAQAYPQETGDYALELCIDHAVRAGIPLRLLHYTIANYGVVSSRPGAFKPPIAEWDQEIRAAKDRGVRGVSFWSHDWTVSDVKRLAAAS